MFETRPLCPNGKSGQKEMICSVSLISQVAHQVYLVCKDTLISKSFQQPSHMHTQKHAPYSGSLKALNQVICPLKAPLAANVSFLSTLLSAEINRRRLPLAFNNVTAGMFTGHSRSSPSLHEQTEPLQQSKQPAHHANGWFTRYTRTHQVRVQWFTGSCL